MGFTESLRLLFFCCGGADVVAGSPGVASSEAVAKGGGHEGRKPGKDSSERKATHENKKRKSDSYWVGRSFLRGVAPAEVHSAAAPVRCRKTRRFSLSISISNSSIVRHLSIEMHRPAAVLMVVAVLSTWAATATGREGESENKKTNKQKNTWSCT